MKTVLYLGTDPKHFIPEKACRIIHYPVITVIPRPLNDPDIHKAYKNLQIVSHILFTSKYAVRIFYDYLLKMQLTIEDKKLIAIGKVTAMTLSIYGCIPEYISQEETQEGIIDLLKSIQWQNPYFLWPHSSLSRPVLIDFFNERKMNYYAFPLYDTFFQKLEPIPDLQLIDEIVFTSPSTVKGFLHVFGTLPKNKHLHVIGPITQKAIDASF